MLEAPEFAPLQVRWCQMTADVGRAKIGPNTRQLKAAQLLAADMSGVTSPRSSEGVEAHLQQPRHGHRAVASTPGTTAVAGNPEGFVPVKTAQLRRQAPLDRRPVPLGRAAHQPTNDAAA